MIPASYLYRDILARRWGRDFERGTDALVSPAHILPEWPSPSRRHPARDVFDPALGSRLDR